MRLCHATIVLSLATLVAGCGGKISGVSTEGPSDGSITIRGAYSSVSNATEALEAEMKAEANKNCPQGWTKLDDTANRAALAGGRVWRIKCNTPVAGNAGAAATSGSTSPVAPVPATTAASAPITASNAAPAPITSTAAAVASTPGTTKGALNREDLNRLLTESVMRASPYLTPDAARAIVERQLGDLMAAQIQVVGPSGQAIPLAP